MGRTQQVHRKSAYNLKEWQMAKLNLEILAYEPSPLGMLLLRRRELLFQPGTIVTEVTLNHEFLMSSLYTHSERALAETAVELHGGTDLQVLVGGLGLGYTAYEAIQSEQVASVEVVEFLPQVIEWLQNGLVPLSPQLNDHPKLTLTAGDVYQLLDNAPKQTYDVIVIDVDHSPDERLDESSISFYTKSGLQAARKHLAPGGVLGVWSYAESSPFADAMRDVFSEVVVKPVSFRNELVDEDVTDWLFFART
ncbi:MAG: spermidine synthase [Pirellulaceae bacterium]|jgi:spermidine synthase